MTAELAKPRRRTRGDDPVHSQIVSPAGAPPASAAFGPAAETVTYTLPVGARESRTV